jgi:hypothetical protein
MRTPTRRTQLPNHISDSTTQVSQDHAATRVLLVLGTNNHIHRIENAAEHQLEHHWPTPVRSVSSTNETGPYWQNLGTSTEGPYTVQASVANQSDRFKPGNPKSTKQDYRPPNWPKLETTATWDNKEQTRTFTQEKTNKALHWSDRWTVPVRPVRLGRLRWTTPAGQLPQIQLSISWIAPQICARLWG